MSKNLHQRLQTCMQEVDYIQREKKQGMRYSIVSHDAVTAKVRPVLVANGVVYYPVNITYQQDGNRTQVSLTVRFANVDDPKDYIDVPSLGFGIDEQDKGPGKAISYAVKYALLKALGLETGDDPDEDQEAEHNPAPARPAPTQQVPTKLSLCLADPHDAKNNRIYDRGSPFLDALEHNMAQGNAADWWALNGATAKKVATLFPQAVNRVRNLEAMASGGLLAAG